ncbi:DUF6203 family protein [Sphaerisporangium aureirubrum]|uniref:DUF6203 family protein n=1 Tax=Sphaerisporangium aureirubrum TaxID=1544736 RepID=A0ABW1NIZ7_9ACTN
MKRILKLVVTRWLARTPLGLVALGVGWFVMRRRRKRNAAERPYGPPYERDRLTAVPDEGTRPRGR